MFIKSRQAVRRKSTLCFNILVSLLVSLFFLSTSWAVNVVPRIVGGEDASTYQFPWQVILVTDPNDALNSIVCGGTIINEKWILTAAHCYDPTETTMSVIAGITRLDETSSGEISQISRWVLHPDYNDNTLDNDIALLELVAPINLSACGRRCEAIGLVTKENEAATTFINANAKVSGWGNTVAGISSKPDEYPANLQWVELSIMSCVDFPSRYPEYDVTDNMFCAGDLPDFKKDACGGDSGGPLVVANNQEDGFLLAGIVSWGWIGCAMQGYPGVFTKVANYTDWIRQYTGTIKVGGGDNNGNDDSDSGSINGVFLLGLAALVIVRIRKRKIV